MKKRYEKVLYLLDGNEGFEIFTDVIVEDGAVQEILAGEDFEYQDYKFEKGEMINSDGDNSLIRSEDIDMYSLEDEEFTVIEE